MRATIGGRGFPLGSCRSYGVPEIGDTLNKFAPSCEREIGGGGVNGASAPANLSSVGSPLRVERLRDAILDAGLFLAVILALRAPRLDREAAFSLGGPRQGKARWSAARSASPIG